MVGVVAQQRLGAEHSNCWPHPHRQVPRPQGGRGSWRKYVCANPPPTPAGEAPLRAHTLPSERLNIQTDMGQTIYDTRTLTPNLCRNQPEKPNHTLCRDGPRTTRTQCLPASSPSPPLPLSTNSGPTRETKYAPQPITEVPLLVSQPLASGVNHLQSEHTWSLPSIPL